MVHTEFVMKYGYKKLAIDTHSPQLKINCIGVFRDTVYTFDSDMQ